MQTSVAPRQPGGAQHAVGRCQALSATGSRVGRGAASCGAGWKPAPNTRFLWWTSPIRPIPG